MKNFDKYKTMEERAKAFYKYCLEKDRSCKSCQKLECMKCQFKWLDLEAEEEKPLTLPCPFCGKSTRIATWNLQHWQAVCDSCGYCSSQHYMSQENAVAAHNRIAKIVLDAKAKEASDEDAK